MRQFLARSSVAVVLSVVLFFASNILVDKFLRGVQLDMTEDQLYSLSQGSAQVMSELEGEVSFELYFSRSLAAPYPGLLSYGKRVETLLQTLVSKSGGKAMLRVIDAEPFSEQEDLALSYGLRGIPLDEGQQIYMGLRVSNDIDGEKIIPFLSEERERFLEYDIVQAVATLNASDKPTVGLLSSLPLAFGPGGPQAMMQGQSTPYELYSQMRENYTLVQINSTFAALPEALDGLLIVHPPKLSPAQQQVVTDFVLGGGKTMLFLDPLAESLTPQIAAGMGSPKASDIPLLMQAVGLQMTPSKIIGDGLLAQKVMMGGSGSDAVKDYLFWLNINGEVLDEGDIVTATVDSLALASVGALVPVKGGAVDNGSLTLTPLITSSKSAMLYDAGLAETTPDLDALITQLTPDDTAHNIAVRLTGNLPKQGDRAESQPINLFVMADSDLFDDRFWVQIQEMLGQRIAVPTAGNGSFVLGLMDQMTGNDALMGLRARGIAQRPFTRVEAMRRAASDQYRAEEKQLESVLQATQTRIAMLEQGSEGEAILSTEQQAEIDQFRAKLMDTRGALRKVKGNLRRDIDALDGWLTFLNSLLIPILVVNGGMYVLWRRRKRSMGRRRRRRPRMGSAATVRTQPKSDAE